MAEGQNRAQVGRLMLFAALWLMLFILSVKFSGAWVARSLSLMAESLHTLLTSFSILLSLLKVTAPTRPKARLVPTHGKRETVLTFLMIAFLGFVGFNVLVMSAQHLAVVTRGEILAFPVRVNLSVIQLLGFVILSSLGFVVLGFYQAKVLGNSVLRFIAGQLLRDTLLTILVLGGLFAVWGGMLWLDAVLAILLVLLAVASCWQVVSWQLPFLVQPSAIAPEAIAQIARQVGGVTHCYQIQSRGLVGRFVYIQMRLIIHPNSAKVTSLIAARIGDAIQRRYGPVQVTCYIEDNFVEPAALNPSPLNSDVNGKSYPTSVESKSSLT